MKRMVLALLLLSLTSALLAEKGTIKTLPLLALRWDRHGYENIIWMEQRAKIGGEAVTGYIQATGGRDDAIIAFELKEKWDALEAHIGYLDGAAEGRNCTFMVEGAGGVLFESDPQESKKPGESIRVDIRGQKQILLRISADRYNATALAAWGAPTLVSGLSDEDLQPPLKIDIDGTKSNFIMKGGVAPRNLNVPIPLKEGTHEYKVKVDYSKKGQKVKIVTEEAGE